MQTLNSLSNFLNLENISILALLKKALIDKEVSVFLPIYETYKKSKKGIEHVSTSSYNGWQFITSQWIHSVELTNSVYDEWIQKPKGSCSKIIAKVTKATIIDVNVLSWNPEEGCELGIIIRFSDLSTSEITGQFQDFSFIFS